MGAPASRAMTFRQAGHPATEILELYTPMRVFDSAAIKGLDKRLRFNKRLTKRAPALLAEHVKLIEAVNAENPNSIRGYLAGMLLFILSHMHA